MTVRERILFLIFLCAGKCYSQNLAPNGSFEEKLSCPSFWSQIDRVKSWSSPGSGSPDYFNACDNSLVAGVPINKPGSQEAKDGQAYAGFYAFIPGQREYIQGKLNKTLVAGKEYCVEFSVSLADRSPYAVDRIGIFFSYTAVAQSGIYLIPNASSPQIENSEGNIIQDKNAWTKISGTFIAAGGEQYLTIGNFHSDATTNVAELSYSGIPLNGAYYYIDDIHVEEEPELVVSGDTFVCPGENLDLQATGASSFRWTDESGLLLSDISECQAVLMREMDIRVYGEGLCGVDSLTIHVIPVSVVSLSLGPDTSLCPGDSLSLGSGYSMYRHNWSTGDTVSEISIKTPGDYFLHMTDSTACLIADTVIVTAETDCPLNTYIPLAFTPNDDGMNDRWQPVLSGVSEASIEIFDRWGTQVLVSHGKNPVLWDGLQGSEPAPEGIYSYVLSYISWSGLQYEKRGKLSLLR